MHVADGLFMGNTQLGSPRLTTQDDPTQQLGARPMAQVYVFNLVPLAISTNNIAVLQAPTSGVAMALTAGTGNTLITAPDLSGVNVVNLDCERAVSLTSTANLSGINFLITGFTYENKKQTQLLAGPNNNTVVTKKAFQSVLSVVPQGTSASTVSVGTSDVFGLPFRLVDLGYVQSAHWAGLFAQNAGTPLIGDATSPSTNLTGDTQGTYAQSGAASNGVNRLVLLIHLDSTQCGPFATYLALYGVTPA